MKSWGDLFEEAVEEQHGASLDLTSLRPTGDVVVALSSYGELRADVEDHVLHQLGPYYLVPFAPPGGTPAVLVAVSTTATDVRMVGDELEMPVTPYGYEFRYTGIRSTGIPWSPEAVHRWVERVTGAGVLYPPTFVAARAPGPPQAGRWRVRLDRPLSWAGTDAMRVRSDVVFIKSDGTFELPSRDAPTLDTIRFAWAGGRPDSVAAPVGEGLALAFEPVALASPD